jgi:hypothetical protein
VAGAALRSLLEVALVFGNTLNKVEGLCYAMLPGFVFGCFDSFRKSFLQVYFSSLSLAQGNRLGDAKGITVDSILLFHEVKASSMQRVDLCTSCHVNFSSYHVALSVFRSA